MAYKSVWLLFKISESEHDLTLPYGFGVGHIQRPIYLASVPNEVEHLRDLSITYLYLIALTNKI